MKALGVLESKWDLIRRKLVRCLLEEQAMLIGGAGQGASVLFCTKGGDEEEW